MKVLFAVNDENISTSIVKKYQKQYKEIISYKNVYYFNAILKELQRNKTYDRVVISEDLEEFTSSSYAQKDRFIFDKLDGITDEAVTQNGTDIPIILICSERRTKGEDILVKIFGIGIYNAMIGEDRSIDEVCRLINKPRSKKEAKNYYKIDADNVSYERESDSEVSEMEIQNILMHFKKLGRNEEKYVESFKNIVSQYNEQQMRVIIAILPNNVKEVLEERSPEYQKIAFPNGRKSNLQTGRTSRTEVNKKKTSEKLLNENNGMKLSRPVVVPTTMENNIYKKVSSKKPVEVEIDELEEDIVEPVIEEKPKRRGRPRKNPVVEEPVIEEKTKRRGRPKKISEQEELQETDILPGFEDEIEETQEIENKENEYNYSNDRNNIYGNEVYEEDEEYEEDEVDEKDETYGEDEDNSSYTNTNSTLTLSGFEEDDIDDENYEDDYAPKMQSNTTYNRTKDNSRFENDNTYIEQYSADFNEEEFESLLSSDKKIVAFVGTSKNGTSFIVNNVAHILSNLGIDTAILDITKNKNAYYIYTKNDEELRKTAIDSIIGLSQGRAKGIKVNNKLTVYTTIPSQEDEVENPYKIMETLLKNHSLVLLDCDFESPIPYFSKSQELYLVQSMDVLTIQPLTSFLRELKVRNVLDESKIRIVLNKLLKVRGVTGKNIIGGMSNYNDPEMSFMTELFDRNLVRVSAQIPFDEDVYAKYLESLIECEIKINGYPKEFKQRLNNLAEVIYPLLPNKNAVGRNKKEKKGEASGYANSFSSDMNNTLDNMRKRY